MGRNLLKNSTKKAVSTAFLCKTVIEEYDESAVRLIIREIIINKTGQVNPSHGISSM